MPAPLHYLAIDIGASSGRAMLGTLYNRRLSLQELHRFPNQPLKVGAALHWDTGALFAEIIAALTRAAAQGVTLDGIGIDTWGVDYALLDSSGTPLAPPRHYRDPRTRGLMDDVLRTLPRETIYSRTGIQFLGFSTLYQLRADQLAVDNPLARARSLLFVPDLLNFKLTGIQRSETTIASTSQLLDPRTGSWADDLIDALALPRHIFPALVPPATTLGPLLPELARASGSGLVPVISVGSHDTASAVAAVPAPGPDPRNDPDWAYISSGTWSLVGRELRSPLRSDAALHANFTNECGIDNTIRFHKNLAGLWLLQECQRCWSSQGSTRDFATMVRLALGTPPLRSFIDPDHQSFAEFCDMPARIRDYCQTTRQPVPVSEGSIIRCVLESLALKTRAVLDTLESLTGPVRTIHIVGGGAQNALLCQFTANAAAKPVLAGPAEATAAGNIMTQALAQRAVSSLHECRAIIASSLPPTHYHPADAPAWVDAYERFRSLLQP